MDKKKKIESIKSWAEADRPREKLMLKGRSALSDAELVAILLGSGSRNESALSLSQRILADVDNHLHELGKLSLQEMMKYKGIGEAKAITIAAALELGRRRANTEPAKKPIVGSSYQAYTLLRAHLTDIPHEEMWMLVLDRAGKVLKKVQLHIGGTGQTVVDVKMIMKTAIDHYGYGIILAHNHPSGALRPSGHDLRITEKIFEAGKLLDVKLLDHLIITDGGFYSFKDEGRLEY